MNSAVAVPQVAGVVETAEVAAEMEVAAVAGANVIPTFPAMSSPSK